MIKQNPMFGLPNDLASPGNSDHEILVDSSDAQYTTGYSTQDGRQLSVTIKHVSNGKATDHRGKILEVSTDGVKLATSTMIPIGDSICLNLEVAHLNISFSASAIVSWAGHRSENDWRYGCALTSKLQEPVIKRLASGGYIERRQAERQQIQIAAHVHPDNDAYSHEVRLEDYSSGGFRFTSQEQFAEQDRLVLELDCSDGSTLFIPARVCWTVKKGSGYTSGCQFMGNNGFDEFQNVVEEHKSQTISVATRFAFVTLRLSFWGWIGLVGTTAWCFTRLLGF